MDKYELWMELALKEISDPGAAALEVYDDPALLYRERTQAAMLLNEHDAARLLGADLDNACRTLESCEKNRISVITRRSPEYPARLLALKDPPRMLFVMGRLPKGPGVAVVGARDADDRAFDLTKQISFDLAAAGVAVISGFAVGIDRAAHTGALDAGGVTVAVLGCGLLTAYPRDNVSGPLKERIAERGAVISEYTNFATPTRYSFPKRNRITAALSDAFLTTQAAEKSGTLGTARYAQGLSKPMFVTPPLELYSGKYGGVVKLINQGARQIGSAREIIDICFGKGV